MSKTIAVTLHKKWPQQVFTHLDDDGTVRTFLIETMLSFAKAYQSCTDLEYIKAPINAEIASYLRKNAGIEQRRVKRFKEPYASIPILAIRWPDQTICVVDGNYRVVRGFEDGKKELDCICFKYPFWENFLMPEEDSKKLVAAGVLHKESNIA